MRYKNYFSIILIITILIISIPIGASAQVIRWKFQDTYGAPSWPAQYLNKPFIEWVQKVTNGKLLITRYEPGALAPTTEAFDALSKGVFDAAYLYAGYYTGIIPEGFVEMGLPWAWTDAKAHILSLFQFGLFDIMKQAYERKNIHLLAHYPMGDVHNIGTIKQVTKLGDLKGMKIRTVGIYGEYVKALGATPVSLPYDEIYMALKMGTIDGYQASAGALIANKLGEVIHSFLLPTNNSIGTVVAVNKKSWDALPKDIKDILDNTAPQAAIEISTVYAGVVDNSIAKSIKDYGVKFNTLSEADQQRAISLSLPLWDNVAAKNPECKRAVDSVKTTLRYLGRLK